MTIETASRPETDDANEAAVKAARDAYRPAWEQGLAGDIPSCADWFGWHAAIKAVRPELVRDALTTLRDRLIRDQAVLMERKVAAYNAGDTTREAHLDGQITGIGLALRYIAEEATS